ncbi:MAG: hypothetical protein WC979_02810 [Candidatus Pacearchaeota archaeon]|jgi:hypothetical protein|nr:hypothetical protein [Clostridia bacterium]
MLTYLLYYYQYGSLRVQGNKNSKTATGKFKHYFDSAEECEIHAINLNENSKYPKQFVIVESNGSFDSKIVKVLI